MADKFRIFSTEIAATLDPDNAGPAPATNIVFDQDPHHGVYEQISSANDRGSVIQTLGGSIIQDFGTNIQDKIISFSDTDALQQATITDLIAAYAIVDEEWYFTDGYGCWTVQFSRSPSGFVYFRNLLFSEQDLHVFSYSINLLVRSQEI